MKLWLHLRSSLWSGRQESFGPGHQGCKVHFHLDRNVFRMRRRYSPGGCTALTAALEAGYIWMSITSTIKGLTYFIFLLGFETIYVAQDVLKLTISQRLAQRHLARTYLSWGFAIKLPSINCSLICHYCRWMRDKQCLTQSPTVVSNDRHLVQAVGWDSETAMGAF